MPGGGRELFQVWLYLYKSMVDGRLSAFAGVNSRALIDDVLDMEPVTVRTGDNPPETHEKQSTNTV